MPKITFFNLPVEKQLTLITAAKNEFSRVPLFEASISNIIKEAGIPRGSFYQYFDDKEDAFFYLLNEFAEKKKQDFIQCLMKNDGDLFATVIEFFELIVKEVDNVNFLKIAFLNMTHRIGNAFEQMISDEKMDERFKELSVLINKQKLNVSTDKELFHVLQVITTIMFRNIIQAIAKDLPNHIAIENFSIELELIKNGIARK